MKNFEYVSPEMEVIEIKTQGILATSETSADGGFNNGTTPPPRGGSSTSVDDDY